MSGEPNTEMPNTGLPLKAYRVMWEIDIEATDPETAARRALAIQRDPNSIATVFKVDGDWNIVDVDVGELNRIELEKFEAPIYGGGL